MSTRGTFRRRGARVDAIEDGVDKGELLARAREATRATYGEEEEARGAIGASSSAAGSDASVAGSRMFRSDSSGTLLSDDYP